MGDPYSSAAEGAETSSMDGSFDQSMTDPNALDTNAEGMADSAASQTADPNAINPQTGQPYGNQPIQAPKTQGFFSKLKNNVKVSSGNNARRPGNISFSPTQAAPATPDYMPQMLQHGQQQNFDPRQFWQQFANTTGIKVM